MSYDLEEDYANLCTIRKRGTNETKINHNSGKEGCELGSKVYEIWYDVT